MSNKSYNDYMKQQKQKMTIKPSSKYKMSKEELKMHLHLQRKGGHIGQDKSKYKRNKKHKRNYEMDI